ncbi:MAG TPA: hypothetical protein VNB24_01370 [Acidimicrobiales bacterium]|nr:hypothetical protein [Acidimicrobiales bacterium]
MLRQWTLRIVAAAMLLSLSGCKVSLRVGVEAGAHGDGAVRAVVTLDRDAQRFVGDLKGKLRVDDLARAGWTVTGPDKLAAGAVRVTATKRFADPSQVTKIVSELDGGKGLFAGFRLRQDRSFLKTTSRFEGRVDLSDGIESFSDDTLREQLGSPLGASPEELSQRIGSSLADALPITVGVRLAGSIDSNAPQSANDAAAWHPRLGEDVRLNASATHWNVRGIGFAALSVTAGLLGGLSALRYRRRGLA